MPNTPVRAAAEGMPSISRRKALAFTGAGIAAAFAGSTATAAPSQLAALIKAHGRAYKAFNAALDREEKIERAYRAAHSEDTIIVPNLLGGGLGLSNGLESCRADIARSYQSQRDRLGPLARIAPDLAEQARAVLDAKEAENMALVDRYFADEEARKEAFGYAQAERDQKAADEAEQAAALALCAYRCATIKEAAQKARYLQTGPGFRYGLEPEQQDALLCSMISGGAAI